MMCAVYSPGLLEELSQSSESLTQCLSVDTGELIYCCCNFDIANHFHLKLLLSSTSIFLTNALLCTHDVESTIVASCLFEMITACSSCTTADKSTS